MQDFINSNSAEDFLLDDTATEIEDAMRDVVEDDFDDIDNIANITDDNEDSFKCDDDDSDDDDDLEDDDDDFVDYEVPNEY